jgi:hypothetical protein
MVAGPKVKDSTWPPTVNGSMVVASLVGRRIHAIGQIGRRDA